MKTQIRSPGRVIGRFLALCLGIAIYLSTAHAVTWTVAILPAVGGDVTWATTSPPKSGVLTKSGTIVFNSGSFVDLTFTPDPVYAIKSVYKNAENWTTYLDGAHHYRFGPVGKAHTIVVVFTPLIPTGSYGMSLPTGNPNLTQIADVTGNYSGVSPTRHHRAYNVSVTMDEDGKLMAMGTVQGTVPKAGDPMSGKIGEVDTITGKPTFRGGGTFTGTRDGVPATCVAAGRAPLELKTLTSGQTGVGGTASYRGKVAGVPYRETNVPLEAPASAPQQANLRKAWGLMLTISKKTDAKTHREYIAANASLKRPDGDTILFPERRLRYSVKYGYSVLLSRGTNLSMMPAKLDVKTSVYLRRMTMAKNGVNWRPSGGMVTYRFLGQKGTAKVTDFVY